MTNVPATRTTTCERTAGGADGLVTDPSPNPCVHTHTHSHKCGWRVWMLAGDGPTSRAHAPMHAQQHMSEPGGSNPGGLSRSFRDGTRRVPSPEPQGRGASRALIFRSVGTDLRRPGTAINILDSQYPEPGGTAPRPQVLSLNLHRLISPAGAVTHGRAVGEKHRRSMGGRRYLSSL